MAAMTLKEYRLSIGLSQSALAQHVERYTGVSVSRDLIIEAERIERGDNDKRAPMAMPKAEAICKFLSAEMGRPVTIGLIKDLKIVV